MFKLIENILGKKDFKKKEEFEVILSQAKGYADKGQWELSIEEYERALIINSAHMETVSKLAELYQKTSNKTKQTEYLQKLFDSQDVLDLLSAWRLIDLYQELDSVKVAGIYERLISQDVEDVSLHFKYAKTLSKNNNFALAMHHYKLASKISERDEDWEAAAEIYKEMTMLEPDNNKWKRELGYVLSEDERWQEAISTYQELTKVDDSNANNFYNLGRVHTELDEYNEALNYLEIAITLEPEHVNALCYLGIVHQELECFDDAISFFKQAVVINSDYYFAYFNMSISYIALSDIDNAIKCFKRCSEILHGHPLNENIEEKIKSLPISGSQNVFLHKILHDCEQFSYLASKFNTPFLSEVAEEWNSLATELNIYELENQEAFVGFSVDIDRSKYPLVLKTINKPINICPSNKVLQAINPKLDFDSIQESFINGDMQAIAIDNILTDEAWYSLQEFCNVNTFWYGLRPGYLGAFSHDGFYSELLFQIAIELREKFPRIFKHHSWRNYWGFKHDKSHGGINVHADVAALNVNFWITPSEANLDPNSGGLLVWDQRPPPDWNFKKLNEDDEAIKTYLKSKNSQPFRFPYKGNRALIFSSDLFHKTDEINFKPGYTNRRLNITMLYGRRKDVNKWG